MNGFVHMKWDVEKQKFQADLLAVRAHEMWLQLPKEFDGYQISCKNSVVEQEGNLYRIRMEENGSVIITL